MELKHIISIFQKRKSCFLQVVLVCVALGMIGYVVQKPFVATDLTLNIARLGSEQTNDYQYHEFYRLQADERFADTVVRWIGSARIVMDINTAVGLEHQPETFKAERLSSQMIRVTYNASDSKKAEELADALVARVNEATQKLNQDQQTAAWFAVQGEEPVIVDGHFSSIFVFALSLSIGIFLGFWAVLLRYYFEKPTKENG